MAHALQGSHEDLERKVREKTASIAVQNQRLAALYAVSALAAEAGSLEVLAQGFVQQIRGVSGSDAAACAGPTRPTSATCCWPPTACRSPGRAGALPEHRRLRVRPGAGAGAMRVIPIAPAAAAAAALPRGRASRPWSASVQLHQRLLGEVTLFYRTTLDLSPDMRELLSTMARHLASAMEGLRATALEREAAVAEERSLIARELHDSIAQSLAFLKIQTQLLRDAVAKGNAPRATAAWPSWTRACASATPTCASCWCTFARAPGRGHRAALRATLSKFEHQTGLATTLTWRPGPAAGARRADPGAAHRAGGAVQRAQARRRARAAARAAPPAGASRCATTAGLRPRAVPPTLHVGLGIMRERAQRIGAGALESRPAAARACLELPPAPRRPRAA
jgi:two-component system nitrate/nitrite sensor histidine kinase NarX